jgi:hypothetical protein
MQCPAGACPDLLKIYGRKRLRKNGCPDIKDEDVRDVAAAAVCVARGRAQKK